MNIVHPTASANADAFLHMLARTIEAPSISPRGMLIREVEDLQLDIDPRYPFMSFNHRGYDVNYFKKEMRWKLGANKYDESIKQHAKMWDSVQNDDGTFNSNYGQFWFGEQQGFMSVVQELMRDPDSRRAVIPMLDKSHMQAHVRDTVCTEAVGFRIRNGCLNMSIHMRSSDQIFGLGTDIPTFCFLYRLVWAMVNFYYQDSIGIGQVTITAMSSHIYERHFKMVNRILDEGHAGYKVVNMPWPTSWQEAMGIVARRGQPGITTLGHLHQWIMENIPDATP